MNKRGRFWLDVMDVEKKQEGAMGLLSEEHDSPYHCTRYEELCK